MESKLRKRKTSFICQDPNMQVAFRIEGKFIKMMDRVCKKQIITRSHFIRQAVLKELTKIYEEKNQ